MPRSSGKILFLCAHCGKHLAARADLAGKAAHCVRCRAEVQVPGEPPAGIPAPPPLAAAFSSSAGTAAGDPLAFDTQVVPAPVDLSTTILPRANDPAPGGTPPAFRPRRGSGRSLRSLTRRVVLPVGAGALAAGIVIGIMAITLHVSASPRKAHGEAKPPATAPASADLR